METNTEAAFKWIVGILQNNNIPFQISGGFAAKLYGSDRVLFDIDIDIEGKNFKKILPFVKTHILSGPALYYSQSFDVELLTLEYQGQRIDLSSSEDSKIYDPDKKQWQECSTDYNIFTEHEVYGLKVPVITLRDLIEYKRIIRRPTDLEDIDAISKNLPK